MDKKFTTHADIPIDELYSSESLRERGFDEENSLGQPGAFPYTRGVYKSMYRGRRWTMRQYAGFGTAADSNKRYHYLLGQGQTGLSVAFDLPTQMGRDSDHALCAGEVGKVGVAIDSLEDMEVLLDKLPLDKITTSMTINSTAATLLSLYVAVADRRGVPRDKLGGTIQNDILKEYIARGTYIYPPRPSMRLITDTFSFCKDEIPRWNTISISGYHTREAGADAVQEVAFTLAAGIAYVEAALATGQKIDEFAPRLAFFFNGHNNFFEEVAKFRAARRLWARIMRDRFGAKKDKSLMLRFHTQTAGVSLAAQQPLVNIARVTVQALAAVLGGTQSLHTNSYDEALGLPTQKAARVALRTQQVIAHESGVADFVDPLAGSYVVESLTDDVETRARAIIDKIDELGGMITAIETGYPMQAIEQRAYEHQQAIEKQERIVVGVNEYQNDEQEPTDILRIDPQLESDQVARLQAVRNKRDSAKADTAIAAISETAKADGNLVPKILHAVKAHCTVGEIADAMRDVFGEYQPSRSL